MNKKFLKFIYELIPTNAQNILLNAKSKVQCSAYSVVPFD